MITEALLLGLSTGTYCTMNCGPVLIPFLFGAEDTHFSKNTALVGVFLGTRLLMYIIFGTVAAFIGLLVNTYSDPVLVRRLSVFAYIFCGLFLLCNSLGVRFPWGRDKHNGCKVAKLKRFGNDWLTAAGTGLAVGLHICPPLWTAFTRSVFGGDGFAGIWYFLLFYIGTLPYFLPLLGIPFVTRNHASVRNVARITQLLVSLYFIFFAGLIPLFFG